MQNWKAFSTFSDYCDIHFFTGQIIWSLNLAEAPDLEVNRLVLNNSEEYFFFLLFNCFNYFLFRSVQSSAAWRKKWGKGKYNFNLI